MSVLEVRDLSHVYSKGTPFEQKALDHVNLSVERGEFLAIIGHTGSGKSTLIQHLNGLLRPTEGDVLLHGKSIFASDNDLRSVRFHIGLVFQYPEYQLFEETIAKDIAYGPTNMGLDAAEIERRVTQAMEDVGLDVSLRDKSPFELSGGQKRRVALAGVVAMQPEILVLDEPTNHLDIASKEILENALNDYTGTVLYVSHDRYFINQTATRILELTGETVVNYIGNYDYYLEKHEELTKIYVNPPTKDAGSAQPAEEAAPAAKADWQEQKAKQAQIRKIENALKKTEKRIEELETKIAEIDEAFAKPENATNSAKLNELSAEQNTYKKELEQCYEDWEELSMQLDS